MNQQIFLDTLRYVVNVPYFWLTMGMVSASAMFCGAIILNGDIEMAWRSLLTKIVFITLLFQVNYFRVTNELDIRDLQVSKYSYATIFAMTIVTFFWIFGMILGVYTSHFIKKKYRNV
jgi:hypothetical protein